MTYYASPPGATATDTEIRDQPTLTGITDISRKQYTVQSSTVDDLTLFVEGPVNITGTYDEGIGESSRFTPEGLNWDLGPLTLTGDQDARLRFGSSSTSVDIILGSPEISSGTYPLIDQSNWRKDERGVVIPAYRTSIIQRPAAGPLGDAASHGNSFFQNDDSNIQLIGVDFQMWRNVISRSSSTNRNTMFFGDATNGQPTAGIHDCSITFVQPFPNASNTDGRIKLNNPNLTINGLVIRSVFNKGFGIEINDIPVAFDNVTIYDPLTGIIGEDTRNAYVLCDLSTGPTYTFSGLDTRAFGIMADNSTRRANAPTYVVQLNDPITNIPKAVDSNSSSSDDSITSQGTMNIDRTLNFEVTVDEEIDENVDVTIVQREDNADGNNVYRTSWTNASTDTTVSVAVRANDTAQASNAVIDDNKSDALDTSGKYSKLLRVSQQPVPNGGVQVQLYYDMLMQNRYFIGLGRYGHVGHREDDYYLGGQCDSADTYLDSYVSPNARGSADRYSATGVDYQVVNLVPDAIMEGIEDTYTESTVNVTTYVSANTDALYATMHNFGNQRDDADRTNRYIYAAEATDATTMDWDSNLDVILSDAFTSQGDVEGVTIATTAAFVFFSGLSWNATNLTVNGSPASATNSYTIPAGSTIDFGSSGTKTLASAVTVNSPSAVFTFNEGGGIEAVAGPIDVFVVDEVVGDYRFGGMELNNELDTVKIQVSSNFNSTAGGVTSWTGLKSLDLGERELTWDIEVANNITNCKTFESKPSNFDTSFTAKDVKVEGTLHVNTDSGERVVVLNNTTNGDGLTITRTNTENAVTVYLVNGAATPTTTDTGISLLAIKDVTLIGQNTADSDGLSMRWFSGTSTPGTFKSETDAGITLTEETNNLKIEFEVPASDTRLWYGIAYNDTNAYEVVDSAGVTDAYSTASNREIILTELSNGATGRVPLTTTDFQLPGGAINLANTDVSAITSASDDITINIDDTNGTQNQMTEVITRDWLWTFVIKSNEYLDGIAQGFVPNNFFTFNNAGGGFSIPGSRQTNRLTVSHTATLEYTYYIDCLISSQDDDDDLWRSATTSAPNTNVIFLPTTDGMSAATYLALREGQTTEITDAITAARDVVTGEDTDHTFTNGANVKEAADNADLAASLSA